MNRTRVAALVAMGLAGFATVAYDATLLADALGIPVQGGEGAVAMVGLTAAILAVASGMTGIWRSRKWDRLHIRVDGLTPRKA